MPNVNIALNLFGTFVMLILFFSCLGERLKRESHSNSFLLMMVAIICALTSDTLAWVGEGHPQLSLLTVIANTAAFCACYAVIFFFLLYMRENLFSKDGKIPTVIGVFGAICILSMILVSLNAYRGISYEIDAHGHYVHTYDPFAVVSHFLFPLISLSATVFLLVFAKQRAFRTRIFYLIYIAFPVLGVILDYTFHGLSVTYIGMVVSTLIIYTNIYLQKRSIIAEQKNALLVSQINPHFTYNTLSAIASLCDLDPKQAKALTMDFSLFLRNNLEKLSATEPITLAQELRHVDCYLKIERARFGEKLRVQYRIQSENFLLPALTVQPIVENAVRHGITKKAGGGTVCISAYQTARAYVVEIKDDGIGFDVGEQMNDERQHVGLQNVRARVQNMCGGTLTVHSEKGVGTSVRLELPKRSA